MSRTQTTTYLNPQTHAINISSQLNGTLRNQNVPQPPHRDLTARARTTQLPTLHKLKMRTRAGILPTRPSTAPHSSALHHTAQHVLPPLLPPVPTPSLLSRPPQRRTTARSATSRGALSKYHSQLPPGSLPAYLAACVPAPAPRVWALDTYLPNTLRPSHTRQSSVLGARKRGRGRIHRSVSRIRTHACSTCV
jgi:hypothetical protein